MAAKGRFGKDTEFSEDAKGLAAKLGGGQDELWIDIQRRRLIAQEYLTYVGEAKEWIEACINEELPPITEFEESLRNGVYLAKLGRFFSPEMVKKIYDEKQEHAPSLRHSDNYNAFVAACLKVGLPKIFYFEFTDLYDRKNMPKVIYMTHALSLYLVKLGLAPKMVKKKYKFTDDELALASEKLGDMVLPSFGDLAAQLDKETGGSKQSEIDSKIMAYEEKAAPLSNWIEEKTTSFENREFNFASAAEVEKLLKDLETFRTEQKPPKHEEIGALEADLAQINTMLADAKKSPYEPPEWMRIAKLRDEWAHMEVAEGKREVSLKLRKELLDLESKVSAFKGWVKDQTSQFSKRNYSEANTDELAQLGAKIKTFRETEKPGKRKELDEHQAAFRAFESKCGEQNTTFALSSQKAREELEKLWFDLEETEKRREQDIAFRIEMIKLQTSYSEAAAKLNEWANKKTGELGVRDYDSKNSSELEVLIKDLEKYRSEEKPPKAKDYEKIKADFKEINKKLAAHEYPEFEPSGQLDIEKVQETWAKLEKSE